MDEVISLIHPPDSPFTQTLTVFRAEYGNMSTNGQGEKSIKLIVDRPDRVGVECLADMAGIVLEVEVRVKPGAMRFVLPSHAHYLPDAEVPE